MSHVQCFLHRLKRPTHTTSKICAEPNNIKDVNRFVRIGSHICVRIGTTGKNPIRIDPIRFPSPLPIEQCKRLIRFEQIVFFCTCSDSNKSDFYLFQFEHPYKSKIRKNMVLPLRVKHLRR